MSANLFLLKNELVNYKIVISNNASAAEKRMAQEFKDYFYKVTGDGQYYEKTDKRKRMIGIECTDFELNEILFYYRFYSEHMKNELDTFIRAFFNMNSLFPDSSARCYEKFRAEHDLDSELSIEDLERLEKMFAMQKGMSRKTPTIQIEDKNKLEGQSCES